MEEKSIEYLREINKTLIKKMGLAKKHLRDIENKIEKAQKIKPTITKNKDLSDKKKKTKISELMTSSFSQIRYHVNHLNSHIFNDEYSLHKYIANNKKDLRKEKEDQLKEALDMGFITADKAEEKRKKWKEQEKRNIELIESNK